MIQKLLIANRGEIACRIIRACHGLGIRTVAVYSDADRDALHVALADEAVRLGPAEAAQSYLDVDRIIDAALRTKVGAIHPGYGFLSERVALAERCAEHGIVWVGPSVDAIARMGSKIESKRIAEAADVPCVPGYHGAAQDDETLSKAAKKIGFPVLIKASAGGGGRGMRRVDRAEDLAAALAMARAEAKAGFGDPALLIEKLILRPRHIEVQLAGDKHGNLIHLFERECSIQRNYQKVVEEAPAPNLDASLREALLAAAVKLGRAIGYDSLGTVEFILDADAKPGSGGPWFLEMNTRLQVEHPVTEMITGLDLVALQIRIADGETLPLAQAAIVPRGSAIEVRLNAEDPAAGYRPCLGTVTEFQIPTGEGIRVDTGIRAGSVVTPYYDSLLAKIIAYGDDRATATARLSAALGDLTLLGIGSSQGFLGDIVDHPLFRAGKLTTRFIDEAFPDGWHGAPETDAGFAVAAAVWADALEKGEPSSNLGPWAALGGFRLPEIADRAARITLKITGGGEVVEGALSGGAGHYQFQRGDETLPLDIAGEVGRLAVSVSGVLRHYTARVQDGAVALACGGRVENFQVVPLIESAGGGAGVSADGGGARVLASMPGLVSALHVEPGQAVTRGDTVVVLEAMKLMYSLPALVSGRVKGIFCKVGDTVAAGAVLVEIEPDEQA